MVVHVVSFFLVLTREGENASIEVTFKVSQWFFSLSVKVVWKESFVVKLKVKAIDSAFEEKKRLGFLQEMKGINILQYKRSGEINASTYVHSIVSWFWFLINANFIK